MRTQQAAGPYPGTPSRKEVPVWLGRLVDKWSDPATWEGNAWIAVFEAPASALDEVIAGNGRNPGWPANEAV